MPANQIWTPPKDWTVGEVVTAGALNTHLRDNLAYLKGVLDGASLQDVSLARNLTVRGRILTTYYSTGGVTIQRPSTNTAVSLILATETGASAGEFALAATSGHFSSLAQGGDLVIRNGTGRILLALGNISNNFNAGAIVGYPSGGVYIGSNPSDPGANNLIVQNMVTLYGRLVASVPSAFSSAPPYLINTAWPTADDLTIRSNNRNLYCIGRVAGYLTGNVYFDGTSWNNFDTNAGGVIAAAAANVGCFGVWITTSGANPQTPKELARLAWYAGGQTVHILRARNENYYSDWPAGWSGGLATLDICCGNVYVNNVIGRSDPALKRDVRPLNTQAKDKIRQLKPIVFKFVDDPQGRDRHGFSAADVYQVMPELCECDKAGRPVGYDLGGLMAYLVKTTHELIDELEALKAKVGV